MRDISRVLFMGSKRLGLRVLQAMHALSPETLLGAVTIDDRHDTRTVFDDMHSFAAAHGLALAVARGRRHSEALIREMQPDICFVVGWYWLLSQQALEMVPHGYIGIHNSLLPRFRGGSPLIWAILHDEREVGFSLFSFTPGMDDGAIWAQGSVVVEDNDYIADILARLEAKTLAVFRQTYLPILHGRITPVAQDEALATYCAQRFPHDGRIEWHKPARDVYNFIRAQSDPYPGAFTYHEDHMLTIWKARLYDYPYYGRPGQVARITRDGVYVVCGDNRALLLEEVSYAAQRGRAQDVITSIRIRF